MTVCKGQILFFNVPYLPTPTIFCGLKDSKNKENCQRRRNAKRYQVKRCAQFDSEIPQGWRWEASHLKLLKDKLLFDMCFNQYSYLQGLFSRITFREPVFLGGTGNITGLAKRLPVYEGMVGCIRRFVANEHEYSFSEHPLGDVSKGFDIRKLLK